MPTFSPTGAPTGSPTAAPTGNPTGGTTLPPLWLLEAAGNAAGLKWLKDHGGTVPNDPASNASYAAAYAGGFAEAAALYGVPYAEAFAAGEAAAQAGNLAAQELAAADYAGGYYNQPPGTADAPAGWDRTGVAGTARNNYEPIVITPSQPQGGQRAGQGGGIDLPSFGTPGTTGSSQPDDAAAGQGDAPVISPPNVLTLADQLAALGSGKPPVAGGADAKTLRSQMKKFSKRNRRP